MINIPRTALLLRLYTVSDIVMKTCEVCGKNYTSPSAFNRHKKVHAGRTFPCAQCGKTFTRKYNASQHEKTAHAQQPELRAEGCQANQCFDAINGRARRVSYPPMNEPARDPLMFLNGHQRQIVQILEAELLNRRGLKFYLCLKVSRAWNDHNVEGCYIYWWGWNYCMLLLQRRWRDGGSGLRDYDTSKYFVLYAARTIIIHHTHSDNYM